MKEKQKHAKHQGLGTSLEGGGGGGGVREKKGFEMIFKTTPHPDPHAIEIKLFLGRH